jgi:hypothetical protein
MSNGKSPMPMRFLANRWVLEKHPWDQGFFWGDGLRVVEMVREGVGGKEESDQNSWGDQAACERGSAKAKREAAIGPWRVGGAHQRQAMEGGAATFSALSYSAHTAGWIALAMASQRAGAQMVTPGWTEQCLAMAQV